jgi:hypothetical protein
MAELKAALPLLCSPYNRVVSDFANANPYYLLAGLRSAIKLKASSHAAALGVSHGTEKT